MSLKSLDNQFHSIAKKFKGNFSKNNTKGMWVPDTFEERNVYWQKEGLQYMIQIYPQLKNDKITKWICWAFVHYDIDKSRYIKKLELMVTKDKFKIIAEFDQLKEKAFKFFKDFNNEDLNLECQMRNYPFRIYCQKQFDTL